jgi:hypothetical protein
VPSLSNVNTAPVRTTVSTFVNAMTELRPSKLDSPSFNLSLPSHKELGVLLFQTEQASFCSEAAGETSKLS